jgi:hypothetical protein
MGTDETQIIAKVVKEGPADDVTPATGFFEFVGCFLQICHPYGVERQGYRATARRVFETP